MTWTAVTGHRAQLGEGPFWDAPTQALYWVDIAGKQALRLIGANVQIWQMPEHVSAFIPCERGDALVTLSSGVYRLDLDSPGLEPRLTLLCVADPQPGNRANEARCDEHVHGGTAALTALAEKIGHAEADALSVAVRAGEGTLRDLAVRRGFVTFDEYEHLTSPGRVNQLGHRKEKS